MGKQFVRIRSVACSHACRHSPAWMLLLVALLVLLAAPRPGFAAAKKGAKKSSAEPKIVMIADSYGTLAPKTRGVTKAWPELVSRALGIPKSRCTIYRHGGYGFAKPKKHFLSLLKDAKRDPEVTDVIIVGGAGNDSSRSKKEILRWYGKTIARIRKLYPNATIMHTITSWDLKSTWYQRKIVQHTPWYQSAARKHGVVYLKGCGDVMRKHPSYFCSDNRHPNQKGQKAQSRAIVRAIRKQNERYAR